MTFAAVAENLVSVDSIHERYLFKKKLGQGGCCDVFLAEDRESGEKVAIKMMEMDPTGEGVNRRVARFRREMMLYSQLDHPNIVKIFDSGETETGLLFIVFEYINGYTLAQLLKKEGALPLNRTMTLMGQVLSALNEAHNAGIIHRDLKPENIMVVAGEGGDELKVLDFGISTFIPGHFNEVTRLTRSKEFLGTPSFAAPEQLRGEPVSTKADIYAWGLIFLECITGKSPFTDTSVAAVVQQQLASSPVPLPAAIVSHRLGTLLRWTLEKDVNRRAGNAAVIASHLAAVSLKGLTQNDGYVSSETPSIKSSTAPESHSYQTVALQQERRQVTIVCCILNVQSSGPDVLTYEVLDEIYQDLMVSGSELFERFGAHVVTDTGDRILAFFGYPDASDTDARRAARSALELASLFARRKAVFAVQHGLQFTYRIGIHTGMASVRKDQNNKPQIFGLLLNTASKLCNAAPVESIIVSKSSYTLLNAIVECRKREPEVSDLLSGEPVYSLIGERIMESIKEIDTINISPMIGRDGELALLYDILKTTDNENSGRIMLIQGEAGIGKSRLCAEFDQKIQREDKGWIECRCLPEGKNSALHPIFDFLRSHFGLSHTATPQQNVAILANQLNSYGIDPAVGIPLFCLWLGLPTEGLTMPMLSPQRQKEIILSSSSDILARMAVASSSIIMVQDLHWADPTTLELLPKLFEQVRKRGVFLLMSARSVFVPSWDSTEVEVLPLSRLEDSEIEIIVRNILGSEKTHHDTISKIVARVDGVPLFAEEVTRFIRDKGVDKNEIPSTLRDLLTGKIDNLGPARETAQLASVIGRSFDYNLIEKVSLKDTASLLADIDQLISAGLLHEQLVVGNPHYLFHHALVRDAAYESIPKKTREEMHYHIAEILEMEYEDVKTNKPELLAYHWAGAAEFEKATSYGVQAASQYLAKSLYAEAIHHANESLELVPDITDENIQIERELQLLQILMPSYFSTKGYAAPEVVKINARTEELRVKLPKDSDFLTSILWGKVIYYGSTPNYTQYNYYLNEAIKIGHEFDNNDLLSALYATKSHYNWTSGEFVESIKNADTALEYYKNKKLKNHGTVFGHDSKVLALGLKALSLTIYGDIESAREFMNQSIEFATSINDPTSKGLALSYQLCMFHIRNEKSTITEYGLNFKEFINRYGLEYWLTILELYCGWAVGDVEKAEQCLRLFQIMGSEHMAPYWNFIAAQIEYDRALYTDCLKRIEKFIQHSYVIAEMFYLPELYRLKALCIARTEPHKIDDIESSFNNAYEFAEKIDAHLFRLRTLMDLHATISDPLIRERNIDRLKMTLEKFKSFNNYKEYYETKEAIDLVASYHL